MRIQSLLIFAIVMVVRYLVLISGAMMESPQYKVIHSESDFEVRLYKASTWMSALVQETSFEKSTKDGFHRLYQYIHGANLNATALAMTAPVLTHIGSSSRGFLFSVRYFIPAKYETNAPQPLPELNLQPIKRSSHCIAVRKFSGFAKDDNIDKEMEALVSSLGKQSTIQEAVLTENGRSYAVAQYNSPYRTSGRLNEVWMNISGFTAEGCPVFS